MGSQSSSLPAPQSAGKLRANALDIRHAIVISVAVMSPAASIFFNTIPQAGLVGAAIPLCYVIGFIIALFVAHQFSELARELPSSGSAYTFVTEGLGARWGFFTGWIGLLAIAIGVPYSFVLMSANLQTLISRWFGFDLHWSFYFVAAVGIVFAIAYIGIRNSMTVDMGFVIFEVIVCLVLAGIILFQRGSSGELSAAPFDVSSVPPQGDFAVGIILSILSFIGFETAATLGEETRNPRRNIPRAVYGSMICVGLFYIVMAYAATVGYGINHMVTGYAHDSAPFDTLGRQFGGPVLAGLIDLVGVFGFFSAALAIVNGGARILYTVGRDGVLPKWTAWTHPKRQTPGGSIAALCAFGLVCGIPLGIAFTPITAFGFLGTFDAVLTLIIYFLVNIACMRFFRQKRRDQFNVLSHVVLPVIGMLVTGGILIAALSSPGDAPLSYIPIIAGAWVLLGVIFALTQKKAAEVLEDAPLPSESNRLGA